VKRRVLHVSTVHAPYDTRIYGMEARALATAGYDVAMAITVGRPAMAQGVRVLPLGAFGGSRFRRLMRNFRAVKLMCGPYDLIHIHDPELLIAAGVALLAGRRIIYDVHEFFYEKFKTNADITAAWIPPFVQPVVRNIYDMAERLLMPKFAGVVVVSDAMVDHYRRLLPADRIAVVKNYPSIDARQHESALRSAPPLAGPYILHTGGVSRDRAFHVIVAAAEHLRSRGNLTPIVNLGPIYLGAYTKTEQKNLSARAKASDVRLLGLVPYEESLRWIAHAAIGYLPMVVSENNAQGQPRKLFEYFTFGLPVVASDFGKVRTIVLEWDAGYLAAPEDGKAHAEALLRMLSDEPVRARYANNSGHAGEAYSFSAQLPKLLALYRLALGTNVSPAR